MQSHNYQSVAFSIIFITSSYPDSNLLMILSMLAGDTERLRLISNKG